MNMPWTAGMLLVLAALVAGRVEGATWVVDDDGGGWEDFTSIQDAIDAASANDTITVYAGTYYESLSVDVTVHLIGNGSADTVVDASGSGDVIAIGAPHVNISGFNITGSGGVSSDAGIHVSSNFNTIKDCDVVGNGQHGL